MRFLRLPEVQRRIPFSRSTIYRKIAVGEFPRPYDLGSDVPSQKRGAGRAIVAWLETDIEEWIRARVDAGSIRDAA